jgi:hypothetical protein
MAEFVQHHAGEKYEQGRDVPAEAEPAGELLLRGVAPPDNPGDLAQQQEERKMHRELYAADAEKVHGPAQHPKE